VIVLTHRSEQLTNDHDDTEFEWLTKMDLYLKK